MEFLTADPAKQPWRELESLLPFLKSESDASKDKCTQLHLCINRGKEKKLNFRIWSSGVKLSNISGEQYISGLDDFVESEIRISKYLSKDYESWYGNLKAEMGRLETTATSLKTSVQGYHDKLEKKNDIASKTTHLFWQACENLLIDILDACNNDLADREKLRWKLQKKLETIYNLYCPKETARQLLKWAQNYPRYNKEKK